MFGSLTSSRDRGNDRGMIDAYIRKMIFHGAAVIWLGLMAGFPFGFVIMGRMEGDLRAWHMAHMEGILNGLLTLAAAAVLKHLSIDERRVPLYAWSFIVAAWTNIVASIIAAIAHQRGLELAMPISNLVVFTIFVVGVLAVLVGLYLVLRGTQRD
jgi:hypothetical protein